ncbi:MAG TPA: hypothetical protein VFE19_14335 [Jatrophihabitantaceae bacterium]|nr:hypothetical protein [Jatrophihabitantaceae bacterium]
MGEGRVHLAHQPGVHDVEWEMPPIPMWVAGRAAVAEFFANRALRSPGRRLVATRANG